MSSKHRRLQRECKEKGLSAGGKTKDLIKRLESKMREDSAGPAETVGEGAECAAILVTETAIAEEEMMKGLAKEALEVALNEDDLCVDGDNNGNMFVGNKVGLRYAVSPAKVAKLEQKSKQLKEKIHDLKSDTALLEGRVRLLSLSPQSHNSVRHRYISTYNRDIRRTPTDTDFKFIQLGNQEAHGGDAVADCLLYTETNPRDDFASFIELYGLHPDVVGRLKLLQTLNLLNLHATARTSNPQPCHDHFFSLFPVFITQFATKGRGFMEGYIEDQFSVVNHAYWACFKCYDSVAGEVGACH
ncbi:unnamed protein product [Tuber aestivum]|uniref:SAP domain-containing protein n=1 Tax=Tuber aestivum TaxID=59557 RepID=A0A292PUX3_9PEZI|nr:unnamed protein product [Tuber aestivum]